MSGIIPAIIFPTASLIQLVALFRRRQAEGVSVTTWTLVGVANLSLYTYTQRYDDVLTIITMLVGAGLNFSVAFTALLMQRRMRGHAGY